MFWSTLVLSWKSEVCMIAVANRQLVFAHHGLQKYVSVSGEERTILNFNF